MHDFEKANREFGFLPLRCFRGKTVGAGATIRKAPVTEAVMALHSQPEPCQGSGVAQPHSRQSYICPLGQQTNSGLYYRTGLADSTQALTLLEI